jgi:hypothetical protein
MLVLIMTVRIELIVFVNRELKAVPLLEFLSIHIGRVFADRKRVKESVQLAIPGKGKNFFQLGCNWPELTCGAWGMEHEA